MSSIVLYMSMSLDGFVTGPNDGPGNELGDGGGGLFRWLDHRLEPGPSGQVYDEALATGAVIAGRRTFELAGRWGGDHHGGVPILVLTHEIPTTEPPGSARYVTGVVEAATLAKAGAGGKDVMVHGAGAAQALLRAGLIDEMEIHLVPVLLGGGRRLFDHLGPGHDELELVRTLQGPGVSHLRYRVGR